MSIPPKLVSHSLSRLEKKTATVAGGCKCLRLFGGAEGDRTPDLRIANAALCQTELLPHEVAQVSNLRPHENTVSSFEFQVIRRLRRSNSRKDAKAPRKQKHCGRGRPAIPTPGE